MITSFSKSKTYYKVLAALAAVAAAVALPQLFHGIGILTASGSALGEILLPMHLPVLLAAVFCGAPVGMVAGALSPIVSYAISGMPSEAMLPFMAIELAAYGLVLGLMSKTKLNAILKVAIALVAGRIIKSAAILLAVYAFGSTAVGVQSIWLSLINGLPGILLQLTLIPLAVAVVNKKNAK